MANTLRLKRSAVQGKAPTTSDLALGELALNTYDGKLYMKKNDGSDAIVQIGAGGDVSVSATAPASPLEGQLWFDTNSAQLYLYYADSDSSQWVQANGGSVVGCATGGGNDKVFFENEQTVTTDYTITTNRNAMSAGPVSIDSGVTVTIPSGSNWVIV